MCHIVLNVYLSVKLLYVDVGHKVYFRAKISLS